MSNQVETIAASVRHTPHSFDHIRRTTGLELTDEQFVAMIGENPGQFKLVRFVKQDAKGKPIRPGRPGVRLKSDPV